MFTGNRAAEARDRVATTPGGRTTTNTKVPGASEQRDGHVSNMQSDQRTASKGRTTEETNL